MELRQCCHNTKNISTSQRVEYIDIYRGFAILLMIMGHIEFGAKFDHYIHAFHMPMWFFVSGYFFRDKGYTYIDYLKRRGKRLLIPYAFFAAMHYIIAVLFIDKSYGLIHLPYIKRYLLTNHSNLPITGVFWFLTCILIADIIFLFFRRTIKSNVLFAFCILTLSFAGILFSYYSSFRLIWSADTSFVALFFYYAGYATKNNPFCKRLYQGILEKKHFQFIIWGINLILILKTPYVNLRTATYPNALLFYFNATVAIMLYLSASYALSKITSPAVNQIKKWLCFVGENTIGYLCLNELLIRILRKYLPYDNIVEQLILLAICMVVLTIITKTVSRTPLRVLIGK